MIREGDGDLRHGTMNGYHNLKCRCEACTRAWTDHYREWSHRKGLYRPRAVYLAEIRDTPVPHGTETGYKTRGCRCDLCRKASAAARRRRRARQAV